MLLLVSLFLLSKIIHIIFIVNILVADEFDEYREKNAEIGLSFPPEDDPDSLSALRTNCFVVLIQYCVLLIINGVAILITKKYKKYLNLIPWLITFI